MQSLSSILLFLGGLLSAHFLIRSPVVILLIVSGFMLNLGVFPLHFWVVPTCKSLSYSLVGITSSPLNIIPLIFLSQYFIYYISNSISYFFGVLVLGTFSTLVGISLGFSARSLQVVLGVSSITHTGWLLVSLPIYVIMIYFTLYSISLFTSVAAFNIANSSISCLGLLAPGGLPPFNVFAGKILVLSSYVVSNFSMTFLLPLLLASTLSLFYYINFGLGIYLFHTCEN